MNINEKQALESLQAIEAAQIAATRRSLNNGVIPIALGILLAVTFPLFDLLPGAQAALIFSLLIVAYSGWVAFYGARLQVQQRKSTEYLLLFVGWGLFYGVIVIGGFWLIPQLLHHKPALLSTVIGLVAAAPLLIGGWRMRRRHTYQLHHRERTY